MPKYTFRDLPANGLFISADRVLREGSCLEYILEKISDHEAVYRDDKRNIQQTVRIPPHEPVIRLLFLPSYPHHGKGPPLPYAPV
ncbi:MAG: hypothetical protein ACMUIA_07555 [bacterium]